MNRKLKIAKPVYCIDDLAIRVCGSVQREKKFSEDEEHKPYIRPKRNARNLPDSYDTQWIRRCKSWKHRVKKRHQWVKHIISEVEMYVLGLMSWGEIKR